MINKSSIYMQYGNTQSPNGKVILWAIIEKLV